MTLPRGPIRQLPDDYSEVKYLVLTDQRNLIRLNLLALVPLILAAIGVVVWGRLVEPMRAGLPATGVTVPWWLGVIGVLVVVFPLHELLHGVAIQGFGHAARYGAKLSQGVLYATADGAYFRRAEYLVVALTPLVVITLLGTALMALGPDWITGYAALAVIINASGAIGDLWMALELLRYPARALVRDESVGFRIFDRVSEVG